MSRHTSCSWLLLLPAFFMALGCGPQRPFYFMEDGDLSHYVGQATEMEYPDVEQESLDEVTQSAPPLTLSNLQDYEYWNLSLHETMQTALTNSKVMRSIGGQGVVFSTNASSSLSPPSAVLQAPNAIQTIYNPAIVESDPRFGTEGALSQFDAQLSTSMFWEKNDRPVNQFFPGFIAPVFEQDLGTFRTELAKTNATGTRTAIRNNTSYEWNSNPSNRFPSAWNTDIEAEFRHPLLQGAGVQFNRVAGPNSAPGVYNGVAIARINTDIALADFEAGVRNLVSDVEIAYWRVYFAYRDLEAIKAGRDSALETWRRISSLEVVGTEGGSVGDVAQAEEQYWLFEGQAQNALAELFAFENRLRYLMGLAATDGRLIRPSDEPTNAEVVFDWHEVQTEAMARSVELRRQKWQIKQRELQLSASKNFLLPRLDAVGRYRWRGFGDQLIDQDGGNPAGSFDNAWETLTDGNFQEWQMGLQMNVPLGFRQQLAAVRNAQLQLAQSRAVLQDQELELSHQMSAALRDLDRYHRLTQTNFNRRVAAERQVRAVQNLFEVGSSTLDLVLDAQRRLADAESAYFRSLVDYNLAITQIHFRKGTLLEYNGVYLTEGPWPTKAYFDATERARQRDAGLMLNYGFTRPNVFSRGPVPQVGEGLEGFDHQGHDVLEMPTDADMHGEMIETPQPTPAAEPDGLIPADEMPEDAVEPMLPAEPADQTRAAPGSRLKVAANQPSKPAAARRGGRVSVAQRAGKPVARKPLTQPAGNVTQVKFVEPAQPSAAGGSSSGANAHAWQGTNR